ncbi:MAG: ABC transporter permease [Gammaproteobacteria bacterium]|nr:ABC transporter permease [Gammaproteobacteria bacterium]
MGLVILVLWFLVALIGPLLAPHGEADFVADGSFEPMRAGLWLGSDYLGRDILSRMLFGARVTIGLSLAATLIAFVAGGSLGFIAALAGGRTDLVISRIYDAFLSMPTLMLGLVVIAALGSSIPVLVVTAGLIYSCGLYRIARAVAMEIKVMDYVEAARARGERLGWIVRREMLPNAALPLAAEFGLRMVFSVLFISALSFLGLGVQPPTADWGVMVRENMAGLAFGSPAALVPALAIASLTIGINLVVDDLSSRRAGRAEA